MPISITVIIQAVLLHPSILGCQVCCQLLKNNLKWVGGWVGKHPETLQSLQLATDHETD